MRYLIVRARFQAGPQFTMRISPDPQHKNLTLEHFAPLERVCTCKRRKSVAKKFDSSLRFCESVQAFLEPKAKLCFTAEIRLEP